MQRSGFCSFPSIPGILSSTAWGVWVPGLAVILQHHSPSSLNTESLCKQVVLFSLLCWAAVLLWGKGILIISRLRLSCFFIVCLLQLKLKLAEPTLQLSCNQTGCFENLLKNKSLVPWAIWTPAPMVKRKERNLGRNISLCSLPALELLGRLS